MTSATLLRRTALGCLAFCAAAAVAAPFRPPSVPLVAHDPYLSIWSHADRLTDDMTRHWTDAPQRLNSLVRIDGRAYRLMGNQPDSLPAFPQTAVVVRPTRTVYRFAGSGVGLTLTFTTPALPDNLEVLARPLTYITWDARSTDGRAHNVSVYFDASSEISVDIPDREVTGRRYTLGSLAVLKAGSVRQPVLARRGDAVRIDWGYLYTAAPAAHAPRTVLTSGDLSRGRFAENGTLPASPNRAMPRRVSENTLTLSTVLPMGNVGAQPVSRWLMVAYDDIYSIRYMSQNLRGYWKRKGMDAEGLLAAAAREYATLRRRCETFDAEFMADMTRVGGEQYATMGALAWRQGLAGNKLTADANGQPLMWTKENSSNGCIATVDLIYPEAPQFLLFGPSLTKALLVPVLDYAASSRWRFPFAPHDIGTYPRATGQVYGGGERTEDNQMPVEETGNMLIIMAALSRMEGNTKFADRYWPLMKKWAAYLRDKGYDPENQLSTDDFAGHLAHNTNLSVKAIVALGAYAQMCEMRGDKAAAAADFRLARSFAQRWVREAREGDHYRLAFDRPNTWSQKYNMVWDHLLGLNLFPDHVKRTEMDFYRSVQQRYGVPLDNRQPYTKMDWLVWTATLTRNRADFDALLAPAYAFLHETPDRVPMSDWYGTQNAKAYFRARPVIGGVYLPMLYNTALYRKWAGRDTARAANWAPFPRPVVTRPVVATSENAPVMWRYTTENPGEGWVRPDFDDSGWQEGPGGFGTRGTPSAVVRTEWDTSDLWIRRTFTMPAGPWKNLALRVHHDEDAEVYINGQWVSTLSGFSSDYQGEPLSAAALRVLRPGENTMAVHVRQSSGGQYIDVGLETVVQPAAAPARRTTAPARRPATPARRTTAPARPAMPRGK